MRVVPERSPRARLATVLLAFLTGPYVALRLAMALTPTSEVP